MDVNTRNELLVENLLWVQRIVNTNRGLIQALHLNFDDVYQDLCITALHAIEHFDSSKSDSLRVHVISRMQYEIRNLKRKYKPHGLTAVTSSEVFVLSLDAENEYGYGIDIPFEADFGQVELTEALSQLSPGERGVVQERMGGAYLRRKDKLTMFSLAAEKIKEYYEWNIST